MKPLWQYYLWLAPMFVGGIALMAWLAWDSFTRGHWDIVALMVLGWIWIGVGCILFGRGK